MHADAGRSSWELADWAGTSEAMTNRVYRHRLRQVSAILPVDEPSEQEEVRNGEHWAHSEWQHGPRRHQNPLHSYLEVSERPAPRARGPPRLQMAIYNAGDGLPAPKRDAVVAVECPSEPG